MLYENNIISCNKKPSTTLHFFTGHFKCHDDDFNDDFPLVKLVVGHEDLVFFSLNYIIYS